MSLADTILAQDLAALAFCWRLERRDGVTIGLTSHDRDLSVIGGVVYKAAPGLVPSSVTRGIGLEPESMDLKGALTSDAISGEDLAAGKWDGAALKFSPSQNGPTPERAMAGDSCAANWARWSNRAKPFRSSWRVWRRRCQSRSRPRHRRGAARGSATGRAGSILMLHRRVVSVSGGGERGGERQWRRADERVLMCSGSSAGWKARTLRAFAEHRCE
jgi:hypothetical protein